MALTLGQLKKLINELGSEFDDLEVGRLVNEGATWGEQFKAVHGVSVTNEALDGPLNGTRDCIVIN